MTWSFEGVAPGIYTIVAIAGVGSSGSQTSVTADLNNCALTVFVVSLEG